MKTAPKSAIALVPSHSLIEAIDTLCQASDITHFLQGAISAGIRDRTGGEWTVSQALGFSILLNDLIQRIEKASDIVDAVMLGESA